MCLKCADQFTSKGITINSLNFYQNLQQPVTIATAQIISSAAQGAAVVATVEQVNTTPTTNNQPTNLSRATDMNTDSNQSSISDQPINIKQEAIGLAEELEKSLQNGDVSSCKMFSLREEISRHTLTVKRLKMSTGGR